MHAAAAEGESEWRPWLVRVRASSNTASAVLHEKRFLVSDRPCNIRREGGQSLAIY